MVTYNFVYLIVIKFLHNFFIYPQFSELILFLGDELIFIIFLHVPDKVCKM